MKALGWVLLCVLGGVCFAENDKVTPVKSEAHSSPSTGPGGRAAGSAAQTRAKCTAQMECSEVLQYDIMKVRAGTGVDKEVTKTGTRKVKSGYFSTKEETYTYKTTEWVPAINDVDVAKGSVVRSYVRPFSAYALDTEGDNPEDVLKAARARLDRATGAIVKATPKELGNFRWLGKRYEDTQLRCVVKEPEKIACVTEKKSRQDTLNEMLEPQIWSGDLLAKMPDGRGLAWASAQNSKAAEIYDHKFDSGDTPPIDADPFHMGDSVLMKETLAAHSKLPVPDRMYCYYIVEKSRPFLDGRGSSSSTDTSSVGMGRYDSNFLFLYRRASSQFSSSSSHTSTSTFSLNTRYGASGALVLEDIAEKGAYTNPLEMKQDSCNRAQERYLVANTFADVLVGCHCSSQRILPNGKVSDYKMFEY